MMKLTKAPILRLYHLTIAAKDKQTFAVESWGPFAHGQGHIFKNPILLKIAADHQRTVAQIILA